jgi:hypothetical protein
MRWRGRTEIETLTPSCIARYFATAPFERRKYGSDAFAQMYAVEPDGRQELAAFSRVKDAQSLCR